MAIKNGFAVRSFDPGKVADVLRACAAECVMPRFRNLQAHEIDTKTGPTDFVTIADREAEAYLEHALLAVLPESIVVGEESVSLETKSLDLLRDSSRPVWVVDPVDGTSNFKDGNPMFCLMVALVHGGVTRAGWIYSPVHEDMMIVERGQGAWLNDKRMKVADTKERGALQGFVGVKYLPKEVRPYVNEQKKEIARLTTASCAGHEYLKVAKGDADFSVYTRMKPWDHLAGTLMVEEAGGYVAKWDGTDYQVLDSAGGLMSASSRKVWDDVHDLFIAQMIREHGHRFSLS